MTITVPTFENYMNPILQVLKTLGGSGTNEEIDSHVIESMGLSDAQVEILHNREKGNQSEVAYRLAWARTYLKKYGLLENSSRGVWALTAKGRQTDKVNPQEVRRYVLRVLKAPKPVYEAEDEVESETEISWRDELLAILVRMDPAAFERLAQRLLRESGFIQVEVTGRTGDGGIDGKGILRLSGLLSFHVIFQCKKYDGTPVTASHVRDFRGAMVGRADKGLLITTGYFTRDAIREATRDGAPAIDLIDGDALIDKLKEIGLGVETKRIEVEQIKIDPEWFANI
jgi:restriction system protein